MTPENFCYWLQGYFELTAAPLKDGSGQSPLVPLASEQIQEIQRHLATVFAPKPSASGPSTLPGLTHLTTDYRDAKIC